MNVAFIGATGRGGSTIMKELVSRGHRFTAIERRVDGSNAAATGRFSGTKSPIVSK